MTDAKKPLNIFTHPGRFSADQVLGVAIMLSLSTEAVVIREAQKAAHCEIVVEPHATKSHNGFFDFSFKGCAGVVTEVHYVDARLTWNAVGHAYLERVIGINDEFVKETLYDEVQRRLDECVNTADRPWGLFSFNDIVDGFNCVKDGESSDMLFLTAVNVVQNIFERQCMLIKERLEASRVIVDAINVSKDLILLLEEAVPWVNSLLAEYRGDGFSFVVIPGKACWEVQTIPIFLNTKKVRVSFPNAWTGLEKEAFQKLTGVPDALFCTFERNVAAAASKEGALALAKLALET